MIVGSRKYTNSRKVKDFVFNLKKQFGDELEIVSGGQKHGVMVMLKSLIRV